jgi:hypothetical protein
MLGNRKIDGLIVDDLFFSNSWGMICKGFYFEIGIQK